MKVTAKQVPLLRWYVADTVRSSLSNAIIELHLMRLESQRYRLIRNYVDHNLIARELEVGGVELDRKLDQLFEENKDLYG